MTFLLKRHVRQNLMRNENKFEVFIFIPRPNAFHLSLVIIN